MGEWERQAIIGVLGGGGAFAAVFFPIVVVQSRRYGRVSLARLVGAAAISVYAVALLAYTFIPLPDSRTACLSGGIPPQLTPFAFVGDVATDVRDHGTGALLTGRATLQVVLNVLLFVPLGVIARRYWSFGILTSTALGLLASLVIEATQLTGIWGLYACAYRVADVDDLLANTAGALLGALVAPVVLWWMPRTHDLRSRRLEARPVTVWRRWLGMLLDLTAFATVSTLVSGAIIGVRVLLGGIAAPTPLENVVVACVAGIAVVLVPALVGSGGSIGQRLVWLEPATPSGVRPALPRRLSRAATTGGAYTASVALGAVVVDDPFPALVVGAGALVSWLLVVAAVLSVPLTRGRRGLSGVLSGTEMVDSRTRDRRAPSAPSGPYVP